MVLQFVEPPPSTRGEDDRQLRKHFPRPCGKADAVEVARQIDVGEQKIDACTVRQMCDRILRGRDRVDRMAGLGERLADDFRDQCLVLDQEDTALLGLGGRLRFLRRLVRSLPLRGFLFHSRPLFTQYFRAGKPWPGLLFAKCRKFNGLWDNAALS